MNPSELNWRQLTEVCAKTAGMCKIIKMRLAGIDGKPSIEELAAITDTFAIDLAMSGCSEEDPGTWEDVRQVLITQLKRGLEVLNAE